MLRTKKGFTLIELMVVIVIIGVLASLAIPRFTEASLKAKMAEAPRVMASYASAQLAAVAETGETKPVGDLIFTIPTGNDSKWFSYAEAAGGNATTQGLVATGVSLGGTWTNQSLSIVVNNSGTAINHPGNYNKMLPNFR